MPPPLQNLVVLPSILLVGLNCVGWLVDRLVRPPFCVGLAGRKWMGGVPVFDAKGRLFPVDVLILID